MVIERGVKLVYHSWAAMPLMEDGRVAVLPENGLPVDHGLGFRRKAREVGIVDEDRLRPATRT